MELSTWLEEERGRASKMAEHFGVSMSAISQWRADGVPLNRMRAVQDYTDGVVTLDEMVPHGPAPAKAAA